MSRCSLNFPDTESMPPCPRLRTMEIPRRYLLLVLSLTKSFARRLVVHNPAQIEVFDSRDSRHAGDLFDQIDPLSIIQSCPCEIQARQTRRQREMLQAGVGQALPEDAQLIERGQQVESTRGSRRHAEIENAGAEMLRAGQVRHTRAAESRALQTQELQFRQRGQALQPF